MTIFRNIGIKLATVVTATGLAAGTAFAATGVQVNVTLPDSVSVGYTTLGSGQYTITEYPVGASAWSTLVFRNDDGETAAVVTALRSADRADDSKTEVILSPDNEGILHLDKMFIEGQITGYKFVDTK